MNDNLIRNPVVTGCRLRTSDAAWKTTDFLKPNCPFPRPGSLNVLEQNKMKSRGYTCICSPMPVYIIPEDETQTRLYVHVHSKIQGIERCFISPQEFYWETVMNSDFDFSPTGYRDGNWYLRFSLQVPVNEYSRRSQMILVCKRKVLNRRCVYFAGVRIPGARQRARVFDFP